MAANVTLTARRITSCLFTRLPLLSQGLVWVKEIWSLSENAKAEEDGNLETKKRYDDDALLYFDNTDNGWFA